MHFSSRDMLTKGGSAVDAAIAALLCIGLSNAQSSGIGGGFFMLHYNARTRTVDMLDAREIAPLAAHENMYENETEDASTKGNSRRLLIHPDCDFRCTGV